MTKAEITRLITALLCRQKRLAAVDVTPATRLVEDLGMDSLDLAELFATIQQETGMQSGARSLSEFDTVDTLAESVLTAAPGQCPVPAVQGS